MVILRTRNKITDFLMILAWASPFKGHLVYFGYSYLNEFMNCVGPFFFMLSYGQYNKLRKKNNSISLTIIFTQRAINVPEYTHLYTNAMSPNI